MKTNNSEEFFNDLLPEYEKFVNRSIEISDRIEEILKKKNITQRELAEKLGKSESEISKWMCGTHNFTIKSLSKIETVLNEDIINIRVQQKNEVENITFSLLAKSFLDIKTSGELTNILTTFLNLASKGGKKNQSYLVKDLSKDNLITIDQNETKIAA